MQEYSRSDRTTEAVPDPGLFEILSSTRAIRRLKPEPVPLELIRKILDAGTKAPSGLNTQPWEFIVIRDEETKRWFQENYLRVATERFGELRDWLAGETTADARLLRAVFRQAEHMHEVPVLLLVCGHRDWPFWIADQERVGTPPPPYGAIFPCVQNILLAARALGLGAAVTTMHRMFEGELEAYLGVPPDVAIVAALPIGFPAGRFGPVRRVPAEDLTHFDRWGERTPRVAASKPTFPRPDDDGGS